LSPDYSALAYNISCCYALLGESDSAIAWLEKTFELGSYLFREDEDLTSLRSDERFRQLAQQAEQKIEELKNREWLPLIMLPDAYVEDHPYPVVVGLHGFGTNPDDFARALQDPILKEGYIFCCPYGPYIGGTTSFGWGGCEDASERILAAIQHLSKHYLIDEKRVILLGFSQGGGVALCTGFRHPERFAAIISIAGYYDEGLAESLDNAAVLNLPVYMMAGENDFVVESNREAERAMIDRGLKVKLVVYAGMGHAFPPNGREEVIKALTWVELSR
jgi:predicted esterase